MKVAGEKCRFELQEAGLLHRAPVRVAADQSQQEH
jgi:hypothetical protein